MKSAFYLVTFMVAQVVVVGAVAVFITKHTIDQYDTSGRTETIVIKDDRPPPEAKPEPKAADLGRMVFDNERPLVPADWKVVRTERISDATCTAAVGPDGQTVVAVEFDTGRSMSDAEAAIYAMMEKDGWTKSTDYMAMWKGGRSASISLMLTRNKTTYAIGTGSNVRAARYSVECFAGK